MRVLSNGDVVMVWVYKIEGKPIMVAKINDSEGNIVKDTWVIVDSPTITLIDTLYIMKLGGGGGFVVYFAGCTDSSNCGW